jgi:dihydroneopterin aldolase
MRIEVIDYPIFMKIGCFRHERLHGQEVLVTIFADLSKQKNPGMGDDLSNTIDYGDLIRMLDQVLKDREFKLIESAVNLVGLSFMNSFSGIARLDVVIEKPVLPGSMAKSGRIRIFESFDQAKVNELNDARL